MSQIIKWNASRIFGMCLRLCTMCVVVFLLYRLLQQSSSGLNVTAERVGVLGGVEYFDATVLTSPDYEGSYGVETQLVELKTLRGPERIMVLATNSEFKVGDKVVIEQIEIMNHPLPDLNMNFLIAVPRRQSLTK